MKGKKFMKNFFSKKHIKKQRNISKGSGKTNKNGYKLHRESRVTLAINAWAESYEPKIPEEVLLQCLIEKCLLCRKEFYHNQLSEQTRIAATHYSSKAHTTQANRALIIWQNQDLANRILPCIKTKKLSYIVKTITCSICRITCNSEDQMEKHLIGTKHQENSKNFIPSNPKAFHVFA